MVILFFVSIRLLVTTDLGCHFANGLLIVEGSLYLVPTTQTAHYYLYIREVPQNHHIYLLHQVWIPLLVLLMEEILHHLGYKKTRRQKNKINYQPQLVSRISESINVAPSILGYLSTACSLRHRWCQLHRSSHDARHRPRHRPGAAAAARAACKQSMSS